MSQEINIRAAALVICIVACFCGCSKDAKLAKPSNEDLVDETVDLGREIRWKIVGVNQDGSRRVEQEFEYDIPLPPTYLLDRSPDGRYVSREETRYETRTRVRILEVPANEDIDKFVRGVPLPAVEGTSSPKKEKSTSENIENLLKRASFFMGVGRNRKGQILCSQALELDPQHAHALSLRARAFGGLNDTANAAKDLKAAYSLEPQSIMYANNYAWFLSTCPDESFRNGDLAVKVFSPLKGQFEKTDSNALGTLAACYAEKGDFETAVRLSKAALLMPSDAALKTILQNNLVLFRSGKAVQEPLDFQWPHQIEAARHMDRIEAFQNGTFDFRSASEDAQAWWEELLIDYSDKLAAVAALCDELEKRKTSLVLFHYAYQMEYLGIRGGSLVKVIEWIDEYEGRNQSNVVLSEEEAEELNSSIWELVKAPYRGDRIQHDDFQKLYKFAVKNQIGAYLNTLATVHLREGNFSSAIALAQKSLELTPSQNGLPGEFPGDLAVLALSFHLQGNFKQRDSFVKKLSESLKHERFAKDPDCQSFVLEATNFLYGHMKNRAKFFENGGLWEDAINQHSIIPVSYTHLTLPTKA